MSSGSAVFIALRSVRGFVSGAGTNSPALAGCQTPLAATGPSRRTVPAAAEAGSRLTASRGNVRDLFCISDKKANRFWEENYDLRHLALAAICAAAFSAPAFADTTVTMLHVSEDKTTQPWARIAKDYEAAHPGVKVEVKYLENEAFKAKLPTMLQADKSRPSLFYTWGGGVMDAQAKAGFLKDVTPTLPASRPMCATAVNSSKSMAKRSACRSIRASSPSSTTRSCSRRRA